MTRPHRCDRCDTVPCQCPAIAKADRADRTANDELLARHSRVLATVRGSFTARYPGTCHSCGQPTVVGDVLVYVTTPADRPVHADPDECDQ